MIYPAIETERLRLRTLTKADTREAYALYSDPDVMRFTDIEPCASLADAEEIISYHLIDSGCRYGLFLRPAMDLIGSCGYHRWRKSSGPIAEVGYDLARTYWGQGYMSDGLTGLIDFGFNSMVLAEIEAFPLVENERSIRLLKRLGFKERHAKAEGHLDFCLRRNWWKRHMEDENG